jgi:hypothetical protein
LIDFSGGSFLYSTENALGLNTMTPVAALDISTNYVKGISISSSNVQNENILAKNGLNKGITLGVDLSSTHIYFNFDTPLPGVPDGGIYYTPGGYLNIDVSKNVNISCPLTVSVGDNPTHINGEVFTVYDISQGVYFGNIYQNKSAYTGQPIREKYIPTENILKDKLEKEKSKGQKRNILILGGSQGAEIINNIILKILPNLLEKYNVIHQVGQNNFQKIKIASEVILKDNINKENYHYFAFDNLAKYFPHTDICITRAGSTLFELSI